MINVPVAVEPPSWPVRFIKKTWNGLRGVLGPLITRSFWAKLFLLCAEEMVSSFMKTLGGNFMTYGLNKENPEVKRAAQHVAGSGGGGAFSTGMYSQRTAFTNGYSSFNSSPRPTSFNQPSSPGTFPGMG